MQVNAFFVEQESRDVHRHLGMHCRRVVLHRLFLNDAQDVQGGRFGTADMAGAVAARAGAVVGLAKRRTQALARQFHQTKAGNLADLHAGAVVFQRIAQPVLDFALVALRFHVDEVDDHQATEIAQPQLAGGFVGGFEVGAEGGFFDVGAAGGTRGVNVDGDQRFGMVDDDGATGGQVDRARKRGFNLVFDLKAREQRHIVVIELGAVDVIRHHVTHELHSLFMDRLGVDQDFTDFFVEVVADRTDDQAGFLENQEGAVLLVGGAFDGGPQLEQVFQIPVQFFGAAADAGGAGDHAHAVGHVELGNRFLEFCAFFAFDAARDAAAAGIVRHQHQVTAGEADEGGQRGALVAAFVLIDLDDDFLAFLQSVLDAGVADINAGLEVGAGDFLEGEESVAVVAVIDKRGFEAGLDAGDDALVDVAFSLLFTG